MKKSVMPKQAAPVERLAPATAGAEKGVEVVPSGHWALPDIVPFAGDDAE